MFFASVQYFRAAFDFREPLERVVIDLTGVHIWDGSAVAALDKVVLKFRAQGVAVEVIGLNDASTRLVEQLGTYYRVDAAAVPVGGAHGARRGAASAPSALD